MAENIKKVFPNNAWYNDTDSQRYDRVMNILEAYKKGNLDKDDVRWFIKCAYRRIQPVRCRYLLVKKWA